MTSTAYENAIDNTGFRKLSRKISRIEIKENATNDEFTIDLNNGASTSRENLLRISSLIEENTTNVSENSNERTSLKTNENSENQNSNNESLSEQPTAAGNNAEVTNLTSNEHPQPNTSLMDRVRALETKINSQNQQIFGLAIALKMAKDETDEFLDEMIIPACKTLSNFSHFTKLLAKPMNMTDLFSKRPADFTWTVKDFKEKLNSKTFEMTSEEFQLSGYPNKAKAKLQLKADGWLYTSLFIVEDEGSENPGSFKNVNEAVLPSLCCIFKNQRDGHDYDAVRPLSLLFGTRLDYTAFGYENRAFHASDMDILLSKFVRNNAVSVEFHVEAPMFNYQVLTYSKNLNWAVDKYEQGRKVAKELGQYVHCSPYFYCGVTGYRMRVHVLLNGGGEYRGRGVTAMVMFLTGEFDRGLPKSFLHRTTITLVNQKHPDKNIVKSVERNIERGGEYAVNLGTFKEMKKLIYKDILYYQVSVKPIGI